MAPGIGYLIPWFILFTKAEMIDTYSALILDPPDRGLAPRAVGDDRLLRGRPRRADRVGSARRVLALVGLPARGPAARQAGHRRDGHPLVHLLVEQLPVLAHHRGVQDAHAAHRRLQLSLLRGDQLGRAHGGGDDHHAARADPRDARAGAHRARADVRSVKGCTPALRLISHTRQCDWRVSGLLPSAFRAIPRSQPRPDPRGPGGGRTARNGPASGHRCRSGCG